MLQREPDDSLQVDSRADPGVFQTGDRHFFHRSRQVHRSRHRRHHDGDDAQKEEFSWQADSMQQ